MKLAKGASFRFTPRTDQRYATHLTHICPDRCARVAMQHVSCLFLRARADQQKPGVRWRKYHVVDEVERSGFAEHLQMSR